MKSSQVISQTKPRDFVEGLYAGCEEREVLGNLKGFAQVTKKILVRVLRWEPWRRQETHVGLQGGAGNCEMPTKCLIVRYPLGALWRCR